MSKSKKKTRIPETEAKYERICQEYRERDELESLNRKIDERNAWVERIMAENCKRAEADRLAQENRVNAIGKFVATIIIALAIIVSLVALAYLETFSWPVSLISIGAILLIATFRSGYLWHDIKSEQEWWRHA